MAIGESADNTARTNQFQTAYNAAVPQNLSDYSNIMSSYNNFLKNQPGAPTTTPVANAPKAPTNTPMTGDPNKDAVIALYNKYGVTPGGPGSGFTDLDYWSGQAMQNAGGDQQYILNRLEKNLQGQGTDAPGPSDQQNISGTGNGTGSANYGNSAVGNALTGYQNFAQTGGYSPQDLANIRARSIAPIRGIYDSTVQGIQRQNALSGSYGGANTSAALAKAARDMNYSTSDATTNAEANIAQLVQQGKLYGLGGLASTGLGSNAQSLQALQGQNSLYGTTPALTNTFGNQLLTSAAQGINIPSDFNQTLGNIAGILGLSGATVSTLSKIFGLGGAGAAAIPGAVTQVPQSLLPNGDVGPVNQSSGIPTGGAVGGNSQPGSLTDWQTNPYAYLLGNPNAYALNPVIGGALGPDQQGVVGGPNIFGHPFSR